ncbi:MAG: peroxiredoxin [Myxococcota bacterium]
MSIQVGDAIPSVELQEGNPGNKVNAAEMMASGKSVVFAVPGAFTPGCSKTHLPGYVQDADAIKAKGVDRIVCISVNDVFVMNAWGENQGVGDKIHMLADYAADFTRAIGLDVDASGVLGNVRSKRYSMIVEDGKVTALNVEPDGFGLSCSLAPALLEQL